MHIYIFFSSAPLPLEYKYTLYSHPHTSPMSQLSEIQTMSDLGHLSPSVTSLTPGNLTRLAVFKTA